MIDFERVAAAREPIEFILGGKKFTVVDFSTAAFEAIQRTAKDAQDQKETEGFSDVTALESVLAEQLSVLTKAPVDSFLSLPDFTVLVATHAAVMTAYNDKLEAKESAKKPRR